MAVYRVNKSRNYTVMSNFHLRDKNLSLKAVGLLSKMLSFNDGWKFSTRGLSAICKEGPDAILSALKELEKYGYLVRHRQRDNKGRMGSMVFEIYEEPQPDFPHTDNPHMEKPDVDDAYGDEAACLIVDEHGKLSLSDVYNGFDEHTVDLLRQEVMAVDRMPDPSISAAEMKEYGYAWGGMLPMREEAAAEVMKTCSVYRLYADNSEGMVLDAKEIHDHAAKGGIFGVEKVEWKAALERENYLKAAEMSTEDDYGMIDGIINNGPKETESKAPEKTSIMDRLKAAKTEPHEDISA